MSKDYTIKFDKLGVSVSDRDAVIEAVEKQFDVWVSDHQIDTAKIAAAADKAFENVERSMSMKTLLRLALNELNPTAEVETLYAEEVQKFVRGESNKFKADRSGKFHVVLGAAGGVYKNTEAYRAELMAKAAAKTAANAK